MTPRAIPVALLSVACGSFVACSSGNVKVPHPDLAAAPADMSVAAPSKLATATTLTNCLASDGTNVYWSDQGSGAQILKVPLAGGMTSVVATGGDKPGCVTVDGDGVYYTDNGALMKVPASGGAPYPLASGQHFLGKTIVASGGSVYWITDVYGNVDAYNGKNAIVSVPTSGGNVQVVSATVQGSPGGFAVASSHLVWSDFSGSFALPITNATAAPVTFGSVHDAALVAAEGFVVQAESATPGSGTVVLYNLGGSKMGVLLGRPARPLGVNGVGAYVNDAGSLVRLALDGSGATLLATQAPRALVLTIGAAVFTDGTAIFSVPR